MPEKSRLGTKLIVAVIWLALIVPAGWQFFQHRTYKEPVVLGPGVTAVEKLSDYSDVVKGTINDENVYVLDSGKPGGSILILGGTHPEEPGGMLSALLMVENAKPTAGKIFIVPRANTSGSTVTRPGDAYPEFFTIKTDNGERKFRMGDRWSNPLDSWPDPEVYVNYPSKQMLAYMDVRNLNRTWPGRANGMMTERTNYALLQLIKKENVDVVIDLHEAELEYPVISTIVAHQRAMDIAAMASMELTCGSFNMGCEISPVALHGLAHREIGDYTNALVFEIEVPEPFLDRVRGVTDEDLLLKGQDPFVMKAGAHGLLYENITKAGWPIDERVARTTATISEIAKLFTENYPDKPIAFDNFPGYQDIVAQGIGHYLGDADNTPKDRLAYD